MYFQYGSRETEYLKSRDKALGEVIDRKRFEKYRRRFSPCGSVASLYLWAVAGGAIPEMKDYAPKRRN